MKKFTVEDFFEYYKIRTYTGLHPYGKYPVVTLQVGNNLYHTEYGFDSINVEIVSLNDGIYRIISRAKDKNSVTLELQLSTKAEPLWTKTFIK